MTPAMEGFIERWLFDPIVGKLTAITIGILIVIALVRVARGILNRYVEEPGNLYRAKKMVSVNRVFPRALHHHPDLRRPARQDGRGLQRRRRRDRIHPAGSHRGPCRLGRHLIRDFSQDRRPCPVGRHQRRRDRYRHVAHDDDGDRPMGGCRSLQWPHRQGRNSLSSKSRCSTIQATFHFCGMK